MIALLALALLTDSLDVEAQPDEITAVEVYAVLQAADAVTTLYLVSIGGTEMNPILKSIVDQPAAFILLKVGTVLLAKKAPKKSVKAAIWITIGLTINNVYQISKARADRLMRGELN